MEEAGSASNVITMLKCMLESVLESGHRDAGGVPDASLRPLPVTSESSFLPE